MKSFAPLLAACLVVASIACKGAGTSALQPDYRAAPTAISFSACPTKDETNGNVAVSDVYPDTKKVKISNSAKAGSGLKLSLAGQNPGAFSIVAPAPTSIGPNDSVDVSIAFSPDKRSEYKALLTIDDQFEGTADVTVNLTGEGKNLPAQATVETATQAATGTAFTTCDQFMYCEAAFSDTLFDKTVTRQIKLRNRGCPALKITGLAISSGRGGTQGFSIIEPATLPSATSPLILSAADGTEEVTITVAFTPTNDGTGNNSRDAVLTVTSNDAVNRSTLIALAGSGVRPSAYVAPTRCNFTNAGDPCGNSPRVAGSSSFRIANDGDAPIKITSTTFKSTGSQTAGVANRFLIPTAIAGMTLAKGANTTLVVTHTDAPTFVSDILEVKAVLASDTSVEAGNLTLELSGGSKPCLTTEPVDRLNFEDPAMAETTKMISIKNGVGCGTLSISSVSIDSSNFFKLTAPFVGANSDVAPGAALTANVTYKRPASGGMQIGTLRIASNDADYGSAKLITLLSATPLDEVPVAELRACTPAQVAGDAQCTMGATSSLTASLATLGARTITLSGATSYDPIPNMPGGKRAATKYKFTLLAPLPANVTALNLANNDAEISTPTTTLSVTSAEALYRIGLIVYDDRLQQSTASRLDVSMKP